MPISDERLAAIQAGLDPKRHLLKQKQEELAARKAAKQENHTLDKQLALVAKELHELEE